MCVCVSGVCWCWPQVLVRREAFVDQLALEDIVGLGIAVVIDIQGHLVRASQQRWWRSLDAILLVIIVFIVSLAVKVQEHHPEEDGMANDGVGEEGLEATVHHQGNAGVDEGGAELNHLQDGQISFPPQVFAHLGSERGEAVVAVHDGVDGQVDQGEEGVVSAGAEFETNPDAPWHQRVVHNVQDRNVGELFAQDKEDLKEREKKVLER